MVLPGRRRRAAIAAHEPVRRHPLERAARVALITTGCTLIGFAVFLTAVPTFGCLPRLSANESAAVATLRNLVQAQEQFRGERRVDRDKDDVGEYGSFSELTTGGDRTPPLLSQAFRKTHVLPSGGRAVRRSGYWFRLRVPSGQAAETRWSCYAWPVMFQNTGKHTYFVNQSGEVWATGNQSQQYSGEDRVPATDAAARGREPDRGRDGGRWQRLR